MIGTAVLSALVILAAGMLIWNREYANPRAVWPFTVFVGLLAASAITTANLHATIVQTLFFTSCALAAVIASSVFRRGGWFTAALLGFAAAGLVLGAMGATEYIQQLRLDNPSWRVFTTFVSPGYFGGYLVLVIPITLAVFLACRSSAGVIGAALGLGFEVAALFMTGTRFAVVFAFIGLAIFGILILFTRSLGRRQIARLGVAVLVIAISAYLSITPTLNRVIGKEAARQSYSGAFRIATWKGTTNIVRSHPVLGTGAGTFQYVFPRYRVAGYTRNAHNGYLQIAAEAGVPALAACAIAFLVMFVAGAKGLKRKDEPESAILLPGGMTLLVCALIAALVGSLGRNLFDSDFYNPGIGLSFWILAGLLASRSSGDKAVSLKAIARIGLSVIFAAMLAVWSLVAIGQSRADTAARQMDKAEFLSVIDLYKSAIAIDPLKGEYWLGLGQLEAWTARGDEDQWNKGISHMRRAIKLEPTRAVNSIALGKLLAMNGDTKGAIREFRRALVLDPHATPAMLAIAQLLERSKETNIQAEAMYRRMLADENSPFETLAGVPELVNPDYAWAHFYFGNKYLAEKHPAKAVKEFEAAIDRLELRKSYKLYREAVEASGMVNQEEEFALDKLLEESKAALSEAQMENWDFH